MAYLGPGIGFISTMMFGAKFSTGILTSFRLQLPDENGGYKPNQKCGFQRYLLEIASISLVFCKNFAI